MSEPTLYTHTLLSRLMVNRNLCSIQNRENRKIPLPYGVGEGLLKMTKIIK